jgi:hypothetical protein
MCTHTQATRLLARTCKANKGLLLALATAASWVGLGVAFSTYLYGWSFIRGMYFSISTMATGGLQVSRRGLVHACALLRMRTYCGLPATSTAPTTSQPHLYHPSLTTMLDMATQGIEAARGGWMVAGLYALLGVPIYAWTCAMVANKCMQQHVSVWSLRMW